MPKKSSLAIKKGDVSPAEYTKFITSLKAKIRSAQIRAAVAVNSELIQLYWEIGKDIFEKQEKEGWGSNILEKAAKELQNEFPGVEGFSRRNMFRMKAFYQAYAKVPQAVAQLDDLPVFSIPWGHNALILEKIKDTAERLWYASKTIEHGWSRSMLTIWIENDLYRREGKAITNFKAALPAPQSDLAQQSLKDPYVFDFLTLHKAYLSAVDDQLRRDGDQPSIGIILCKTKDNIFAEYVLRNFNRPIGLAEFEVKVVEKLPKELKSNLPTVEEIEAELSVTPVTKKNQR